MSNNQLTASTAAPIDNFDRDDDNDCGSAGALKGGTLLRYAKGVWSDRDHNLIATGTRLIVYNCDAVLQWFSADGVKTIWRDEKGRLADPDELNLQIPQAEWRIGKFDDRPEPPWARYFVVYLIDPDSGRALTYINKSASASIAYVELKKQIRNKRLICGAPVIPVVELQEAVWHSRRRNLDVVRPDFRIIGWRTRGALQPTIAPPEPVQQIEATTAENKPAGERSTPAQRPSTVTEALDRFAGTPAKPPSLKEELQDEIPW
jgi:hypothetical protein